MREGGLGGLAVREAPVRVRDLERLVVARARGARLAADDPEVLGLERQALPLALDDERQGGRLHAAGGAHVTEAAELRHGEVAREGGAPDEVDVLAGLARVGQVLVELDEVREGVVDLGLGERRVAGARHGDVGRDVAHHGEGVRADELALAVEVRADHHGVRLLGEVLEGADDLLLGGQLLDGRPDEVGKARHLPALDVDAVLQERLALGLVGRPRQAIGHVGGQHLALLRDGVPAEVPVELELRGEVRRQDVPAQADGDPLLAVDVEAVDGRVVDLVGLGLADAAQQARDLLRGVVLLGDDELHARLLTYACAPGGAPGAVSLSTQRTTKRGRLRINRPPSAHTDAARHVSDSGRTPGRGSEISVLSGSVGGTWQRTAVWGKEGGIGIAMNRVWEPYDERRTPSAAAICAPMPRIGPSRHRFRRRARRRAAPSEPFQALPAPRASPKRANRARTSVTSPTGTERPHISMYHLRIQNELYSS